MPSNAIVISRPPAQRWIGAVMYLVAAPILSGFIGVMVSGLFYEAMKYFSFTEHRANAVALPVMLTVVAGMLAWCVRDFFRRANFCLTIFPDRIESVGTLNHWTCRYDEIETVTIIRKYGRSACVIELQNGRRLRLPPDVADFEAVETAFDAWLIPVLADRLKKKLVAGQTVEVRNMGWRAIHRLVIGFIGAIVSSGLIFRMHFPDARRRIRANFAYLRQCKTGLGGGFILSADMVTSRRDPANRVRWNDVTDVFTSDAGLIIRTRSGVEVVASMYARHFWMVSLFAARNAGAKPGIVL